jgi:hypothetical protein
VTSETEGVVRGLDEPLAIELSVTVDRGLVDTQLVVFGPPKEPGEPGRAPQLAHEFVPTLLGPLVRCGDALVQIGDEVGTDDLVAGLGLGVDADEEALRLRTVSDAYRLDGEVSFNVVALGAARSRVQPYV